MNIFAVIGSQFGDEGKGRTINLLSEHYGRGTAIVVRYNGGAQAGHTVVHKASKQEHIFHHFGSGTLNGSPAYLSKYFIINPFIWMPECADLEHKMGKLPKLYIDPMSPMTTPYDMLINRELEKARGDNRHGSCGYGINETVNRLCNSSYQLYYSDIMHLDRFRDAVARIRLEYVPRRMESLKIKRADDFKKLISSEAMFEDYISACIKLYNFSSPMFERELENFETVIFEGAQGLCLHESHRFFPNVTRSKTGLENIESICNATRKLSSKRIDVYYVTRAYSVRHGAGPFPTEDPNLSYDDLTNIENPWQGKLRFGHLDLDLMVESVKTDLKRVNRIKVRPCVSLTCMDQIEKKVKIRLNGKDQMVDRDKLPVIVAKAIGTTKVIASWGR